MERRWEDIVGLLGSESLPEFLRVYWNSRNRLVRKADLFKTIRSVIDDRSSAFALVRDLDRQARVYAALRNPDDGSWTPEERAGLSQLQMFNVRQPLALLLAAFDQFSEADRTWFTRLLQAAVVVSLRYNVICGRQSNEQESVYNRIAVAISEQRINSPSAAVEQLRPVYPEDPEFRAAFADKTLRTTSSRNKKVARFVLFQLEQHVSGRSFEFENARVRHGTRAARDIRAMTGRQFDEQQRAACTYRLGNLTLLTATRNRDAGNAGYAAKRAIYRTAANSPSPASSPRTTTPGPRTRSAPARHGWPARPRPYGVSIPDRSASDSATMRSE